MATTSEARALPFFTDTLGLPLESGFIYIGQPGLDPVAYPAVVTSDIAGSVVVAQPVRTTHGHAAAAGALIHLFCPVPYSITILDAAGRLVYASLNETDPIAISQGTSTVQSASNVAELRARDKNSTNQVWVTGSGMYIYSPTDNTSPESLPFVVVGSDGGRYHLDNFFVNGAWVKASSVAGASVASQGVTMSWSDDGVGSAYITNNQGLGNGGFVLRTVNSNNTVEFGRVSIAANGAVNAGGSIFSSGGISATNSIISNGGLLGLVPDGSRALSWDSVNGRYLLPSAALYVNGAQAVTLSTLSGAILANQQANGVGAVAVGTNASITPVLPGTWAQTGTASNSVFLWVRTI